MTARLRRWLRTPPSPLPPAPRLPLWAAGAAVAVLTALQMFRRPTAPPVWDSLIAEDGKIFLTQALAQPMSDNLATSYQGYLHTAPRLIAKVATWFPLEDAALVMSLAFALVVAFLSVYVFEASAAWIASPLLRAVLALAIPFIPVTAWQMAGTVSNLHWYLLYGAFWAIVCPWRTRGWLVASTALVLLAVLSDPLVAVFLPIAVVLAVRARDWRAWVAPGSIVFGIIVTLALRDEGTTAISGSDYGVLPRVFADRVTSSLLVGDRHLKDILGETSGSPFAWASLAFVVLAIGVGLWRLRGRRAWLLAGGAALSVGFFAVAGFARGTSIWDSDRPWVLLGTRYVYLPVLFLLTALLAAVDRDAPGRWRPRALELVAAGLAVASMAVGYAAPHRSSGELRWRPVVAKARRACATGRPVPPVTLRRAGGGTAFLPIDPRPVWAVEVGCAKLD
ncbi:MAG: hypothetical protein QOH38_2040 [Thermoleophilaceae bacterium]|nr:hypothetical protein [Thermoleophilaceae bacterium]